MPDDTTDTDALDFYDIVATGTLYKRIQERSAWTQRKLVVCGQYIYQFTKNDVYKGKFDVIGCSLKIVDSKIFDIPRGHYGFTIENTSVKSSNETGSIVVGRSILFCTPSVGTLFSWLNALSEQIADYMDEYRIFLKRGEIVVANSNAWVYKSVDDDIVASTSNDENNDNEGDKLRVLVTNLPRILLLEREGILLLSLLTYSTHYPFSHSSPTILIYLLSQSFQNLRSTVMRHPYTKSRSREHGLRLRILPSWWSTTIE